MSTIALTVHGCPTASFDAKARSITPVVTFIRGNCANKSTSIRNNKGRITVSLAVLCLQTNRHLDHQVVIRRGDLWRYQGDDHQPGVDFRSTEESEALSRKRMVVMDEGCSSCKFYGCEVSVKQDLDT